MPKVTAGQSSDSGERLVRWIATYGGDSHCADGSPHFAPSVPDTAEEVLCLRCDALLRREFYNETEIDRCERETQHAQVAGTHFCSCSHVMFDEEDRHTYGDMEAAGLIGEFLPPTSEQVIAYLEDEVSRLRKDLAAAKEATQWHSLPTMLPPECRSVLLLMSHRAEPVVMRKCALGSWRMLNGIPDWNVVGEAHNFEAWGWLLVAWAPLPPPESWPTLPDDLGEVPPC